MFFSLTDNNLLLISRKIQRNFHAVELYELEKKIKKKKNNKVGQNM